MLRESVVNFVISQIREGTSQAGELWISQPGVIRTFTAAGQGVPDKAYKLYSAQQLVVPGSSFNPSTLADVPTTAEVASIASINPSVSVGDIFTDLNAPVYRNGVWNYPIIDPAALNVVEGFSETSGPNNIWENTIPAASGQASSPQQIPMPVRWLYLLESGAIVPIADTGTIGASGGNFKPDGTPDKIVARIAFWTDDETSKLNINTACTGMYSDTPIGRGNDSERGNFAAGAAYSAPVVTLTGLASSPPAANEFQRYPGHPAMTSLDVVFDSNLVSTQNTFFASGTTPAQVAQKLLQISPRNVWGGSQLGSVYPLPASLGGSGTAITLDPDRLYATVDEMFYEQPSSSATTRTQTATASAPVPAMSLTPQNLSLARFFLTANSRAPEVTAFNTPRVTIWPVDAKPANRTIFDQVIAFCSSVVDPNLSTGFNGGKREYLFTRSAFDPSKITLNINSSFTGASNVGSENISGEYNTVDEQMVSQVNNPVIYNYLLGLMNQNYPGFGASLSSKFGGDTQQILTEIYDYIRSTNLFDCSQSTQDIPPSPTNSQPYTGRPFYVDEQVKLGVSTSNVAGSLASGIPLPRDPAFWSLGLPYYVTSAYAGQVVPAEIGSTRGFGRFPTIVGATLIFFATDGMAQDGSGKTTINRTSADTIAQAMGYANAAAAPKVNGSSIPYSFSSMMATPTTAPTSVPASKIRAMLLVSTSNPGAGPLAFTHTYDVKIKGMNLFKVNTHFCSIVSPATNMVLGLENHAAREASGNQVWDPLLLGPNVQASDLPLRTYGNQERGSIGSGTASSYAFASTSDIDVHADANPFSFTGATLTASFLVDNVVVQTLTLTFPNFTAPMPKWSPVIVLGNQLIDGTSMNGTVSGITGQWGNRLAIDNNNTPLQVTAASPAGYSFGLRPVLMPNSLDVARGLELSTTVPPYGDARLVAGLASVPASYYQTCTGYSTATLSQAHSLWGHPLATNGQLVKGTSAGEVTAGEQIFGLPSTLAGVKRSDGGPGDWDMATSRFDAYQRGYTDCGAFINKALDCASTCRDDSGSPTLPYFAINTAIVSIDTAFGPNRMLPSAGMFGSLPVGVVRGLPWQTLLFRPAIFDSPSHPGGANPPDHLILDLFKMPVVQPYAISDPFSTAGQVNLNYQIAPFSYIERSTALRGVLYPEKIIAVPTSNAYLMTLDPAGTDPSTWQNGSSTNLAYSYRYPIDRNSTITLFDGRFAQNQPFLTASQICDMPLVPLPQNTSANGLTPAMVTPYQTAAPAFTNLVTPAQTVSAATSITSYVTSFWSDTTLGGAGTADNLRERPYTMIYPRITTKSNTFQIHMKVQSIVKAKNTANNQMQTGDTVVAEYQGSCIVERFLDPNTTSFDPTNPSAQLGPYKFRIVSTRQFSP